MTASKVNLQNSIVLGFLYKVKRRAISNQWSRARLFTVVVLPTSTTGLMVIAGTGTRGVTLTTYPRRADAPVAQHQMAEAALKLDGAWLSSMGAANEVEDTAAAGNKMDYVSRARWLRH
jgi:hypothetical protein